MENKKIELNVNIQTSIEDRVKRVIADSLNVNINEVTADKDLAELGADSLDLVEIQMGLETEFEIEIPDEDAARYSTTVQSVIDYIRLRVHS